MESIINAVKLEGTPAVYFDSSTKSSKNAEPEPYYSNDLIKVHIPNVKEEKVIIADDDEGEGNKEKEDEEAKGTKIEVEGAEEDGFEITQN